ncbi:hypothetical protein RO3G_16851 [Rhizopus delemar RA 99-880]|uniref:Serine/threonine-protein phosphatase 2A activator n=1 Tax=Rhizopus delemar (strain RA 99-880 / ATCC MYA-4621 / FGSC 9543 / NRRL 43880) TaxID=246409 RepID=I1CUL0_RHIO9|nr:hypothetical protein RO3G_16851 [Rhizopus delemar RA 99-880]|eukprot:EIE92140.1 hypothetical protein RO3G_16851 [Rhizopus delemar RA 99-880]
MLRKIPSLPNIYESYQAVEPIRRIHEQKDIEIFSRSQAFDRIMTFIALLNESVHKKQISDPCLISPQTRRILEMLDNLDSWLNDFPPLENPQRFGNKAFRQWMEQLKQHSTQLLETILPEPLHKAMSELREYFCNSFGNDTRIDYGSGHELSFVACTFIHKTKLLKRYLELVRKIQKTYSLEPAGSHGVWGLDDHQFLPYVWGSSQLIDHPILKPKSILNRDTVNHFSNEYMYFRCIQYILEVKRGPFFEHSPMLNDIASLLSWNKVNTGMTKMFIAEVLKKVPVVQHFKFGNLFPFEELKQQK